MVCEVQCCSKKSASLVIDSGSHQECQDCACNSSIEQSCSQRERNARTISRRHVGRIAQQKPISMLSMGYSVKKIAPKGMPFKCYFANYRIPMDLRPCVQLTRYFSRLPLSLCIMMLARLLCPLHLRSQQPVELSCSCKIDLIDSLIKGLALELGDLKFHVGGLARSISALRYDDRISTQIWFQHRSLEGTTSRLTANVPAPHGLPPLTSERSAI